MIQTCHLKKIKAATRNEQFFVFSSPAVDPFKTFGFEFKLPYTGHLQSSTIDPKPTANDSNLLHKTGCEQAECSWLLC